MFAATHLPTLSLGRLATGLPGAAGMLRRCGMTASAAPEVPLAQAAAERALSLPAIVGALEDLAAQAGARSTWPTEDLIAYILERYHAGHRADIPVLRTLALDLANRIEAAPEPRELAQLIGAVDLAMEEHMRKEELRVFPMMLRGRRERLGEWIALLRREHEDAAPFVLRLEAVTQGYRAPADDGLWLRFYEELERFVEDMVAHIYLEEQVLFRRFAA